MIDYAYNHFPFETLLEQVRRYGEPRTDRTGVGALSLFAPDPIRFLLAENRVPLITSKEMPWKMMARELFWMLSGSTSTKDLAKSSPQMAAIWDNWADRDGNLGPTYGAQWRNAGGSFTNGIPKGMQLPDGTQSTDYGVDQLDRVIKLLAAEPNTRRALISLWSPAELDQMALEPCTVTFQFSLRGPDLTGLHLHVYQRSADMMLGVPFDLFQAGLLTHLVARELRLRTGRDIRAMAMTWSAGDAHIYMNQLDAVDQQLRQWDVAPVPDARVLIDPFPALRLLDGSLEPGHVTINNYYPMPAIAGGKIAV